MLLARGGPEATGMWGMRQLVGLLAWLAIRAGADVRHHGCRRRRASLAGAVVPVAVLGQAVGPNKAGRFVTVPEDALEPQRSLGGAGWALWAAVLLVVLLLALGYVRRRWKAGGRPPRWLAWGRYSDRK